MSDQAKALLEALQAVAGPIPVPVPEKIAALLPPVDGGWYWRAMTAAELLRFHGMLREAGQSGVYEDQDAPQDKLRERLQNIALGSDAVAIKLSFALCGKDGALVCDAGDDHNDWQVRIRSLRRLITMLDIELISDELRNLNQEEQASVGKDSPAPRVDGPVAAVEPAASAQA